MDRLRWLPKTQDWREQLRALSEQPGDIWQRAVALANDRLDFTRTNALDAVVRRRHGTLPPAGIASQPVRLAVLGSCTLAHLHAPIRVAALRRNIWVSTYETSYGQYLQELLDTDSGLHAFAPTAILFAFDARHMTQGVHAAMTADDAAAALAAACALVRRCWQAATAAFACPVMQQTVLDGFPPLMGSNEQRLPGSPSRFVTALNAALRGMADAEGVDLVAVDQAAARDGLAAWHDAALWHRSRQDITPAAGPLYGELVARIIAARQGLSRKCLVLDLDDTLWGGTIGDDGLDGIVLGQGSPLGEGFLAVQDYARDLSRRGVILAVCSKNDEANALEPFEKHPDMVLRRGDIAAFRANWDDKAANLRAIATELNIGLEALVFLDDNPFERDFVRENLPMVAVPEVPDDPAEVPALLADAGYFESLAVTLEDRQRTAHYQDNRARGRLLAASSDIGDYLRGLGMRLLWRRFDAIGQQRIVQLINKTNQFNLTTRRHDAAAIAAIMEDENAFGLQLRLLDRFGDNGIVAIVIGRKAEPHVVMIDTWLMSCRVLGRQVEHATLEVAVHMARALGATTLRGEYIPSARNAMVRDHYAKLGFALVSLYADGRSVADLSLAAYCPAPIFIDISEG